MTDVQLRVYDPTNSSLIGTLERAHRREMVDAHNDHGAGSFSVDIEDSQLSMIQPRRVIRWRIDGTDRFASYVDDRPRVMFDPETERPSLRVEGPGLAGWLGAGKGGAIVWPVYTGRTHATARHHGWASHGFSTSSWDNVTSVAGQQRSPASSLPRLAGEPRGWPDGRAEWIFTHHATQSGGQMFHNDTRALFKRNLPGISGGPARIYVAGTAWTLYYDGEEVGSGGGFRNMAEFDVQIPHQAPTPIALDVEHQRVPEFQTSIGIIMLTMKRLDSDGNPGKTIFRTFTPGIFGSGSHQWRALRNPDPVPGVTSGRILRTHIDEAKSRNALPGLDYDFGHDTDSNGEPWAVDTINDSFEIGTQVYDVLQRLSQDYGIEWHVTPSGLLRAFNARGASRTGTLAPFARGTASGEGVRATRILGGTSDGYRSRGSDPLGVGRIEDFMSLGGVPSRLGVDPHLDRRLASAARERDEFDFELSEDSPTPYADFDVGDEYEDGRVTQIVMEQEDAAGAVRWATSLRPTG